jgi:hypothetical protein
VERQAEIISIQNESIKELYKLLTQYIEMEEIDRLHSVECLRRAGAL